MKSAKSSPDSSGIFMQKHDYDARTCHPNADASAESAPFRILSLTVGARKVLHDWNPRRNREDDGPPNLQILRFDFWNKHGSIIAALLTRGESVATVRKLYEQHVPTIMKASNTSSRTSALQKLAHEVFGDERHDVFKTGIGIVATNWKDEMPMILRRQSNKRTARRGHSLHFSACWC